MVVHTAKKSVFVRRLGRHHFAHLRAFSEGLDVQASAKRYLGIEHGHEAKTPTPKPSMPCAWWPGAAVNPPGG